MLGRFIRISLGHEPPPENWNEILTEYSELSNDKTLSKVFQLTVQITYLSDKLNIVQLIINQLSLRRNEELIAVLQSIGFRFEFTDLEADLKKVASIAKSDLVKLQLAQKRYDELHKDQPQVNDGDWNDELVELGKYIGWQINRNKITVGEYVSIKKSFKNYVESLKKSH